MSTDIPRRAAAFTPRRPAAARPATPGPRPPVEMSPEAKRQDLASNDLFEKNAAEFATPTDTRPALVHIADIQQLRVRFSTGAGRLDALTKCANWRLDFYLREKSGTEPFDPLTPEQERDARQFFEKHGARLKGEAGVAPENPIKERERQAQAAAQPAATPGANSAAPGTAAATAPALELNGLAAILAELKGLRGDVVALRAALEARPASPPAAAPLPAPAAPIAYELGEGESLKDFWMESVKVGTDDKTGARTYKAVGHPYTQFGVRIWPEVLPDLGLEPVALDPGVNTLTRRVRVRALIDAEGKAKKVVGLA